MLTNISFDNCLLGQFSKQPQPQFDNINHVILSIWEGSLVSDQELSKIHDSNFNKSPSYHQYDRYWIKNVDSYEGQWIKSTDPNVGLVGMGKRELVRYVFNNFTDYTVGNTIYERILRFSKTTDLLRAKATGTAQMFSLCIVNQDIDATAAVNANNRTNFIIFGSCGDFDSNADLKLNKVNIVQGELVRVSDIKFDFDLTYPTMIFPDPIFPDPNVPEVPVVYEYVEAIPPMTSYSNSVATITASGEFDPSTYPAWKAFQRIYSSLNTDAWLSERKTASDADPYWVKVQFNTPKVITAYRIWNGANPHMMRGSVQASNDNANWTTLDTIDISTVPTQYTWRDLVELNNSVAYTYYRLTISRISDWDAVSVGEFVLFESIPVN